jgi:hypothetical protein
MLEFKVENNKNLLKKTTFRTVLRQICAVFCLSLRICGFVVLQINHKNLRICDLRSGIPKKFFGFAIAELVQEFSFCNLRKV